MNELVPYIHKVTRDDGLILPIAELTHENLGFEPHAMALSAKNPRGELTRDPMMSEFSKAKQAFLTLENGLKVSIIFGSIFYSNGVDTYEAMVVDGPEKLQRRYEDPVGHLNIYGLIQYLTEVATRQPLKRFKVVVKQITITTYLIDANDEDDAVERWSDDGREINEELIENEAIEIEEITDEP